MRWGWMVAGLLLISPMAYARQAAASPDADETPVSPSFHLKVAVDEVTLTFHAEDVEGRPVTDLKVSDLRLLDGDQRPVKVVAFELMREFPIRAGILMDTSSSMRKDLPANRTIARDFVQRLLRTKTDEAFVRDFGKLSKVVQPWSGDAGTLTQSIRDVNSGESRIEGTAIFDTLLSTCLYQFGKLETGKSGNFILLFTDGADNASYVTLRDAVAMCQKSNTAIYAFRSGNGTGEAGAANLTELAAETGGRVFSAEGTEEEIDRDLRNIEADARNQYRLVFQPANKKHDGAFHSIQLTVPKRFVSVTVRSGYYAPAH